MIESTSDIIIKILFVLILGTASLIISQKTLSSLFTSYGAQSLLIAVISFVLYTESGSVVLLALAILTIITKVIIIPYMLNRVRLNNAMKRDIQFRYLTPVTSIIGSILLVFVVYTCFSRIFQISQDSLLFMGAVIGVSLTLIGMMVIFSRKRVVTKTVGYLMMENGILLFGVFVAELPFIIEMLIIVDLIIFIILAVILAFGIESTESEFRMRLNMFTDWFKK